MLTRALTAAVSYVYSQDPALNREAATFDWAEFIKTGDLKYVPAKAGEQLTIFELGRLSRVQLVRALGLDGLERVVEIVAYGVRGVRHFMVGGEELQLVTKATDIGKRLNEETLDRMFDSALFVELATRVVELARLDPTSAQG